MEKTSIRGREIGLQARLSRPPQLAKCKIKGYQRILILTEDGKKKL